MPKASALMFLAVLAVSLTVGGCKGMAVLGALGSAAEPNSTAPAISPNLKLMIFGGANHGTYLGCLNCSEYAADSVWNKYGSSGSPYSAESIFNHYSQFGSPYSTESACNQFATDPRHRGRGRKILRQAHAKSLCNGHRDWHRRHGMARCGLSLMRRFPGGTVPCWQSVGPMRDRKG